MVNSAKSGAVYPDYAIASSGLRAVVGMRTIGVISDTHGLLRPQALAAMRGSALIIHAGDVGSPDVLDALRQIAPVVAVRGNVDTGAWARQLPLTEVVERNGFRLYVLHILEELDLDPPTAGLHAVLS